MKIAMMGRKRFSEEMDEKAGRTEAAAYSIFMNNLIFVVSIIEWK